MQADLTRDTFDPREHFTRVLMQQGRVQLDADWNEQVDILLHYMQTLAADFIGPHGGPKDDLGGGFNIALPEGTAISRITELVISPGRYYVDGILCENDKKLDPKGNEVKVTYGAQPDYPLTDEDSQFPLPAEHPVLVFYLDVWERHVTAIQDDSIREKALGGPDTTTRTKVVWQVRTTAEGPDGSTIQSNIDKDKVQKDWPKWVEKLQPANRGRLRAKAKEDTGKDTHPCTISPEARYRGIENQLYRVQIHKGGNAWDGNQQNTTDAATFKWSRDNGSVVFPLKHKPEGNTVTLEHLGRDGRLSLGLDNWVEIEDDDYVHLERAAKHLLQVKTIDPLAMQVTLDREPDLGVGQDSAKHPLLRRWDHGLGGSGRGVLDQDAGTLLVKKDTWLELEDGIQIYFPATVLYKVQPWYTEGEGSSARRGEKLKSIADRFKTTEDKLKELNKEHIGEDPFIPENTILKVPAYYRTGDYWLISTHRHRGRRVAKR